MLLLTGKITVEIVPDKIFCEELKELQQDTTKRSEI
jgi:hypothetical protein